MRKIVDASKIFKNMNDKREERGTKLFTRRKTAGGVGYHDRKRRKRAAATPRYRGPGPMPEMGEEKK